MRPIAAAAAAGKQLADNLDKVSWIHHRFFNDDGSYKNPIDKWYSEHFGNVPILGNGASPVSCTPHSVFELRRGDVDLTAEVIRIRRAATHTATGYTITTPKSDAGVRDVDIPPHIIPAIEAHLAKHVDRGRDSLIFPADNGGHLQPSTLYRHWYKARAKAGRNDLRWHDLRHSGAVLAAATGASLAELMARLGHSSPQAAMRYQHVAAGRGREIAALLSKLAANETV